MQIFTLASGSTGNCTLIKDNNSSVLIDMGISTKRLKEALALLQMSPEALSGILITHEHNDHIRGLETFVKRYNVPIFAPRTVANHLRWQVSGVEDYIEELAVSDSNSVGALSVVPFRTPHDTPESVGYRITGSCTLGFCTDFGHVSDEVWEGLRGADCAVIEANHDLQMLKDGAYPVYLKRRILSPNGHLSNPDCGELAVKLVMEGAKNLVLAHLSRENNMPSVAMRTVEDALIRNSIDPKKDVCVCVAPEKDICPIVIGACVKC